MNGRVQMSACGRLAESGDWKTQGHLILLQKYYWNLITVWRLLPELHLNTQSVPHSKHTASLLYKPVN